MLDVLTEARLWLRLAGCTGSDLDRSAGEAANNYLKQRQARRSRHPGVAGGLPGSYPVYHEYEPFRHLNWAAKFFADALMMEILETAVPPVVSRTSAQREAAHV